MISLAANRNIPNLVDIQSVYISKKMRAVSILSLAVLMLAGCAKKAVYQSVGEITGPDPRMCPCCGGYFITIDTIKNDYHFYELPANSGLDLTNAKFPVRVELNWTDTHSCGVITVQAIRKIK
jgi:hypothetical protein